MTDNDIIIINSSLFDENENKSKIDSLFSGDYDARAWKYDIKNHAMSVFFMDSNGKTSKIGLFENYRNTIKDMHLILPEDEAVFDVFCAELDAGKDNIVAEFRFLGRNFDICWNRYTGMTAKDENGVPELVVGKEYDITREKDVKEISGVEQDALTGLLTKEKARFFIEKSIEDSSEDNLVVILLDIDDFHLINDAYGKMHGDSVLQTISGLIYTNFMSKDIVGRIAGDQFIVFLRSIEREKVIELVDSLRSRIKENVFVTEDRPLSISAGICFNDSGEKDFEIMYAKADLALHCAKESGKDRYMFFNPDTMAAGEYLGYTLLKMGNFSEDENRIGKVSKKVNKKLFDFSFDLLSKEVDIHSAVEKIFSEVCLHYGLDRAVLHEFDTTHQTLAITSHWSRIDDGEDVKSNNPMNIMCWDIIADVALKSDDAGMIVHNGRNDDFDFFREIVSLKCVPVDAIYYPIMDADTMVALVVFDAFDNHEFGKNEVSTLNSIVRLIRSYLLSHHVKYELQMESVINRNVMEAQQIIYYIIDGKTHNIKYISKYAKELFSHAEYGRKCYETMWGESSQCETCPLAKGFGTENMVEIYDDRNEHWYTRTASKMHGTENEDDVLICVTDVTDFITKVRGEDTLTVADSYDKFVYSATKQILKKDDGYMVVSFGIRKFSRINDTFGYVVGDEILKEFALRASRDLKEGEYISRIKGDDFVFLLRSRDVDAVKDYFTNFMKVFDEDFRKKYPLLQIEGFAGCYIVNENDEQINKCVDSSMKARNIAIEDNSSEGGFYIYSEEIDLKEQEEERVSQMIQDAIKEDRITVFFQPKVNVSDGSIMGAEALVRMKGRDGKLVPPGIFIPTAEKNGMVVDIDKSVYEQTFRYMAKWKQEGKHIPLVSVNVSRLHLIDDNLPEKMKKISDKYGLSPSEIELEITESVFFEDTERLVNMIRRLKDMGYIISMDDFGSGYSTLNFMKTLPVDVIKIDGGFFMRNEMDKKSKAIISAIMQLTENLEFETVSEGVETEEQVEFIKEQGGRCVQGYYFYKPMPAEEFEQLI